MARAEVDFEVYGEYVGVFYEWMQILSTCDNGFGMQNRSFGICFIDGKFLRERFIKVDSICK
jgi:hypothetical protein